MFAGILVMKSPFVLLLALLPLGISAQTFLQPDLLPNAQYHHEIYFPTYEGRTPGIAAFPWSAGFGFGSSPFVNVGFQAAGKFGEISAAFAADLFTPNTVQQPAETPGQVESYRKALEEEAREAAKAENQITTEFQVTEKGLSLTEDAPKSYVNVKSNGGKYSYRV